MICAMALPVLAAGLCLDRDPGAPWVRFQAPGQAPVFIDPRLRDEAGQKVIRLLDTAETPATSDMQIDLAIDCAARRAEIIRLTPLRDGKPGPATEVAPADREPADAGDPFMHRLIAYACEGKPLK